MRNLTRTNWMYSVWEIAERSVMLASPFIFLIGAVLSFLHIPFVPAIIGILAIVDIDLLGFRLTGHVLRHASERNFKKAFWFGLLAIPTLGWLVYTASLSEMHMKLPFDTSWFQLLIVCIAFLLTTGLWQWYRTRKAFDY